MIKILKCLTIKKYMLMNNLVEYCLCPLIIIINVFISMFKKNDLKL